jgi:hypothetical protein
MTVRDIYDAVVSELDKHGSPAFSRETFLHYLNKAIAAYQDDRYNFYAVNQQLTDDLRVYITEYIFTGELELTIASVTGFINGISISCYDGFVVDHPELFSVNNVIQVEGFQSLFTIVNIGGINGDQIRVKECVPRANGEETT